MVAIDNPTGEIKAMVGGYSFEDSKFNRATQAYRQVGSSFKIYVYADALEKGATPFDTILDAPFTAISGGQPTPRAITTKNSKATSLSAGPSPVRATFPQSSSPKKSASTVS